MPKRGFPLFSQRYPLGQNFGLVIYSNNQLPKGKLDELNQRTQRALQSKSKKRITSKLTKSEIEHFLQTEDETEIEKLYSRADDVRKRFVGDEVHIRGIIEASNVCGKSCLYCGLRKENKKIKRYTLTTDEIYSSAKAAHALGYGTVVIQTGEAKVYSTTELCILLGRIKKKLNLAITLSLGELSKHTLQRLFDAGADRYLLRFETSDKKLFKMLKPDGDFDSRFEMLKNLRQIGYQVGSGIMIGLPNQSNSSIADDILLFASLGLDMVGCGPFIANPHTPLANSTGGDLTQSLKLIALTRLTTLDAHIPATTALGTIDPQGRQQGLKCGANIIMPNCTPQKYRKEYLLYPNKICTTEKPSDCATCIRLMIEQCGRKIGKGYGDSLKKWKMKNGKWKMENGTTDGH